MQLPARSFFLLAALALAAGFGNGLAHAAERPNFLVILCDDLGYGDLACYGNPTIKTPHLDKLASQGFRFTDCYSTAPVCSSSRAGLLSGRTPSRVGVYDWIPEGHPMHLADSEITIAELLRDAGYATCQVGKWHCNGKFNSPDQPQPGDQGFEYWFATQNNASPSHHNPSNFVRNGEGVGAIEGYSCQIVADEAIRWLKSGRNPKKPFFQFVCFHEPHEPIASPPDLVEQYPQATKFGEAQYYANVANMDKAVGRLMAALDEQHLAENTLVFFTSDNGPETLNRYRGAARSHGSPGPLRGMKLHLYEAGMRVCGIMRFPGHTTPGKVVAEPVCALDLLPTFCALAGVKPPTDRALDGADLSAVFQDEAVKRATPLYWHYFKSIGPPKAAMRIGDYMVLGHWDAQELQAGSSVRLGDMEIIKRAKLVKFELYNLRDDLAEKRDLAEVEPERLQKMAAQLQAKYAEVQAEGPVWTIEKKAAPQGKKPAGK
ncbi:sulfatase-like hydrolase/transferase [Lignipirellula cremea]|uniref:Arylsulfatase n=1 Tax=Lignipirellula cremea TaxID=2528010 RepID=A0A518E017_9BACT|nr:sulfatase-like hydrolase/transferase [Lignipirellula cremea]QDU97440.1 Arylsulfatase [Lignipirellula cremea]